MYIARITGYRNDVDLAWLFIKKETASTSQQAHTDLPTPTQSPYWVPNEAHLVTGVEKGNTSFWGLGETRCESVLGKDGDRGWALQI